MRLELSGPGGSMRTIVAASERVEIQIDMSFLRLRELADALLDEEDLSEHLVHHDFTELGLAIYFTSITHEQATFELFGRDQDDQRHRCGILQLTLADYLQFILDAEAGVNTQIRDKLQTHSG